MRLLEPLGRHPRGDALERAAHVDRVGDVVERERADREAAAGEPRQQALVLELGEREPQRRARDADALRQGDLGDPPAGRELALEDQLAQLEHRAQTLGAHAGACSRSSAASAASAATA